MRLAAVSPTQRRRLLLRGQVQGVGMRPFLCRLALQLNLVGWVGNTPEGVVVEVEGDEDTLGRFEQRMTQEAPPQARIAECIASTLPAGGAEQAFRVVESVAAGAPEPCAPPDLASCPDCLRELYDPADRRHRYPFLSCSHCGPRYSILGALPFDRERTAMAAFALCPACRGEYENPNHRRFHAQTTCCPACGPQLALWDRDGGTLAQGDEALRSAVAALKQGRIVAMKGVGGFQLLADAGNPAAVAELRRRKHRPDKPFALLADWAMANELCRVAAAEEALLRETAAPIVLLRRNHEGIHEAASGPLSLRERVRVRSTQSGALPSATALRTAKKTADILEQSLCLGSPHPNPPPKGEGARKGIAPEVAPNLPWLGVMLPASPLHHLLLADFGAPLVATSGNRGGEPICIDEAEALTRLHGIADLFLVHDRPILRPLDDSVLRLAAGRPLTLRRARGYAPTPVELAEPVPPVLALGGHLKNTVALGLGRRALLSQHLGDLDDALSQQQCRATLEELPRLFGIAPRSLAGDAHPDYASRRMGENMGLPLTAIPHHYAHAMACMAEHGLQPPLLALAWDGIGLGDDGGLWGGEFLCIEAGAYRRVASFLPLRLPGGEKAVKEPRRCALAALYEIHGDGADRHLPEALRLAFAADETGPLLAMLRNGINAPACSSVGRLFDAVAGLLGLCPVNSHEGQAATLLEAAAELAAGERDALPALPWGIRATGGLPRIDWRPLVTAMLAERQRGAAIEGLAYRFHAGLAAAAVAMARRFGLPDVVLCGGCFQNRLLLELCDAQLRQAGFQVHWPQRIPPNDGGLALGQLWAARTAAPP